MMYLPQIVKASTPWNKGKLIGQKPPLKLREIWAIRIRLQLKKETRELAMFNLAIDSKLRSCDLVKLKVRDVHHGNGIVIFPWDTGHRVKNHIMIRSEVKNETNTQASQSGIQARSGRLGGGAWL